MKNNHLYEEPTLEILKNAGLLTEDNKAVVAQHQNPIAMAHALKALNEAKLLTDKDNRTAVAQHQDPIEAAYALIRLNIMEILTPENRAQVAQSIQPGNEADRLMEKTISLRKLYLSAFNEFVQADLLREPLTDHNRNIAKTIKDDNELRKIRSLLNTLVEKRSPSEALLAGLELLDFGIKLNSKHYAYLCELAKEKIESLQPSILPWKEKPSHPAIDWHFVQILGIAYQPGTAHPIHKQLKELMASGALKTRLQELGAKDPDPSLALKIVFKLMHSGKPDLYQWIKNAFIQTGRESELGLIRTDHCSPSVAQLAQKIKDSLSPSTASASQEARPDRAESVGAGRASTAFYASSDKGSQALDRGGFLMRASDRSAIARQETIRNQLELRDEDNEFFEL